jgi:hypothetical protein
MAISIEYIQEKGCFNLQDIATVGPSTMVPGIVNWLRINSGVSVFLSFDQRVLGVTR